MGDARDVILRRRAKFVAASLAAAGIAIAPTFARAEDAGDAGDAATTDASFDPDAEPGPCLSAPKPEDPEPQSCLCACAVPEPDLGAGAPTAAVAIAAAFVARRRRPRTR
jgi:MYXO-CTERM domain-containing protein